MEEQPDELEELLAGMRGQFLDTATDRVAVIATESSGLAISADPLGSLTLLIRQAHTLKGGGATFGFPSLGEAGGAVEQAGKTLAARGLPVSDLGPLREAVAELQSVLAALRRS
jgi:chemotaxis protein histidine kinase CheA